MKILTRYILKEMLGPTVLGFAFYTSIIIMQRLFDLAGVIIRRSLSLGDVGRLLGLSLPNIVVLTVPMSLLFGILIAVGRLSSDSEIIAMRALGISTRTIYRPVFLFSFIVFLMSLYLMNFVLPQGNTQLQALRAEIFTSSVAKEIKPRIFYDEYENLMIYVNDVDPVTSQWKGVFVADSRTDTSSDATTPQEVVDEAAARQDGAAGALGQRGGQRIIVADTGTLEVLKPSKQIWMNLQSAQNHIWDPRKPERYDFNRNTTQRILLPDRYATYDPRYGRSLREMNLRELIDQQEEAKDGDQVTYNLAWVEIHKKFAIPFACIVFGVLGLPLGITNRRGGKSSGFSLSIAIILFYYVMINNGEQLAAAGKVPPFVGMWTANLLLLGLGIYLLTRANRDAGMQRADGSLIARLIRLLTLRRRKTTAAAVHHANDEPTIFNRLDITFPNILDRYVLREFLKVLSLVLVSVVTLFVVIDYTDIAQDIRQNNVAFHTIFAYYRFRIFYVLNWTLPISVLVSTLVAFGMLSKNNEVTALKSSGVSLYRVSLPILAVAGVVSILAYFVHDFVLPYANQRAARIRNEIEGKTAIAAAAEQKLWFLGKGRYIINFLAYDRDRQELSQVQVFELHPTQFRLTRRVYAESARWNGQAWVFSRGFMRSFTEDGNSTFARITEPLPLYYSETPEDFATEVKSPEQMTYAQLRRYIDAIKRSGYSAEELSVRLYSKTSWPVLSVVMALIALPFAFRIGKRGALYGIGIALGVGILYWTVFALFTKFGEVGNLPPLLAAWAANILFAIAASYLFLHVET